MKNKFHGPSRSDGAAPANAMCHVGPHRLVSCPDRRWRENLHRELLVKWISTKHALSALVRVFLTLAEGYDTHKGASGSHVVKAYCTLYSCGWPYRTVLSRGVRVILRLADYNSQRIAHVIRRSSRLYIRR